MNGEIKAFLEKTSNWTAGIIGAILALVLITSQCGIPKKVWHTGGQPVIAKAIASPTPTSTTTPQPTVSTPVTPSPSSRQTDQEEVAAYLRALDAKHAKEEQ